jgi:general secretion pathway protein D
MRTIIIKGVLVVGLLTIAGLGELAGQQPSTSSAPGQIVQTNMRPPAISSTNFIGPLPPSVAANPSINATNTQNQQQQRTLQVPAAQVRGTNIVPQQRTQELIIPTPAAINAPQRIQIQAPTNVTQTSPGDEEKATSQTPAGQTLIVPQQQPAISPQQTQTRPGQRVVELPPTQPTVEQPPPSQRTEQASRKNPEDEIIPAGAINFQAMPLDQFLDVYAQYVGRTVLRPGILPQVSITMKTQNPLTVRELIQAFDSVLSLNQITMVKQGDKFITAVPSVQAFQEAAAFSTVNPENLPEAGQFVTMVVQLTNVLPSEVVPSLTPFAKLQNGIVAIDSSQTLVLRDYSANVKRMLEIIQKVDVPPQTDYKLEVIPIKYGKVEDIYNVMSGLISGSVGGTTTGARTTATRTSTARTATRSTTSRTTTARTQQQAQPQQQQPGAATSFQQRLSQILSRAAAGGGLELLSEARIIPDDRSNSLVVYAKKDDLEMITNIVSKLDVLLAQVLIEAVIMDVTLDNQTKLGVSSALNPKQTGKYTQAAGANNGQTFLSGITNFAANLPAGFSYFGKYAGDLDVAVNAIASTTEASVLQRPRIQTTHAVPAEFFNGESIPYINSSYYGYSYGPSYSYEQLQVGIRLSVTPFITPDGLVVMEIVQEINDVSGWKSMGQNTELPITTERSAQATISVRDGETVMLGGFIKSSKSKSKSGVPVLKDIPLLGMLFRSSTKGDTRSELIVLLRPKVLSTPQEASIAAGEEKARLPGVSAAEQQFLKEENARTSKSKK